MGLLNWLRSGVTAPTKSKVVVSDLIDIAVPGSWPSARPAVVSDTSNTDVNDVKHAADTTKFPQRLDTRTSTGQTLDDFEATQATSAQAKHPLRGVKNDRYDIYRKWAAESRAQKEVGLAKPAVESGKEMKLKRKAHDEVPPGTEKKKVRFVEGHTELRESGVQKSLILKQVGNIGKKRKAGDAIDSVPVKRQLVDPSQPPPLNEAKIRQARKQASRPMIEERLTFQKWRENQLRAACGQEIVDQVRKEEVAEAKKSEVVQPVPHLVVTSYDDEQLEAARAAEARLKAVETELRSTQAKLLSTTASLTATDGALSASKKSLEAAQRLLADVTLAEVVAPGSGEQKSVDGEDTVETSLDEQHFQPSAQAGRSGDQTIDDTASVVGAEQTRSDTLESHHNGVFGASSIATPEQLGNPAGHLTHINTGLGNAITPRIPPPPIALSQLLPNGSGFWLGQPSAPTVPAPDAFDDFVEARTADEIARREDAARGGVEPLSTDDAGPVATAVSPESADPMDLDRPLSTDVEPSQRDLSVAPKTRWMPPTEPRAMRIQAALKAHLERHKARSVHSGSKVDNRPDQLADRMPSESMVLDNEDEHMADGEHRSPHPTAVHPREVDMLSPTWLSDGVDGHNLSSEMDVDVQPRIQPSPETEYVQRTAFHQPRFQSGMTGRRLDAPRAASSQGIREALDEDVLDSIEPDEISSLDDEKSSLEDERRENAAKRMKAKGYDAPRSESLIPFRLEQDHVNGYRFLGAHGRRAGNDDGRPGDAHSKRRGERDSLGDIMPRAFRNALRPARDGRLPNDRFDGLRSL
ncbi:hypothetical protein LTS14_004773 [Recurvomyces mirabilis]|uniref:uncharacterized protein n=1 Tax=Recurvomyces mirabilis TaxID=574656 RepID=UPI002DE13799|nr:hypothetical protein LTS14_004773 [Recurvomyces mirabilis]